MSLVKSAMTSSAFSSPRGRFPRKTRWIGPSWALFLSTLQRTPRSLAWASRESKKSATRCSHSCRKSWYGNLMMTRKTKFPSVLAHLTTRGNDLAAEIVLCLAEHADWAVARHCALMCAMDPSPNPQPIATEPIFRAALAGAGGDVERARLGLLVSATLEWLECRPVTNRAQAEFYLSAARVGPDFQGMARAWLAEQPAERKEMNFWTSVKTWAEAEHRYGIGSA